LRKETLRKDKLRRDDGRMESRFWNELDDSIGKSQGVFVTIE
jgi:hypothetical protein